MDVTERVIAIISLLTRHKGFHTVTGISKELGISKSTAHRIVSSLERLQWVVRDRWTRRYRLGPGALEIGLSMLSHINIRSISLPYLYQLHDTTNESAMLSLRIGLERVYIEQVESNSELLMKAELGKRYPLWCGAQGKAMLAYMEDSEIEAVIDNLIQSGVPVLASGQVLNMNDLREELAEIRRQGFAVSFGERVQGTAAVAAPIFGHDNRVAGAISVGGPQNRFSVEISKHYGAMVSKAAKDINLRLGALWKEAGSSRKL
jgi:IclR family acetate operon transcriptional repressor